MERRALRRRSPINVVGTEGSADARTQLRQGAHRCRRAGQRDAALCHGARSPTPMRRSVTAFGSAIDRMSASPRTRPTCSRLSPTRSMRSIADGTYKTLLAKWHLSADAVEKARLMPEIKSHADIPLAPANKAPPALDVPVARASPRGDVPLLRRRCRERLDQQDPAHAERLVTMCFGGYRGTRRHAEAAGAFAAISDLKATFFVTGWSLEAHPAMAEAILKAGHEIGHHGYHHLLPDPGDPAYRGRSASAGFDALKRRLGVRSDRLSRPVRANSARNCA